MRRYVKSKILLLTGVWIESMYPICSYSSGSNHILSRYLFLNCMRWDLQLFLYVHLPCFLFFGFAEEWNETVWYIDLHLSYAKNLRLFEYRNALIMINNYKNSLPLEKREEFLSSLYMESV